MQRMLTEVEMLGGAATAWPLAARRAAARPDAADRREHR